MSSWLSRGRGWDLREVRWLEAYEIRREFLAGAELEADRGMAIEGLGEAAAEVVGAGAMLAALDAGDNR